MSENICISGYYGFNNFGDEMILRILVRNLKNFGCKPEITVFSANPEETAEKLEVKSVHTFKIRDVINEIKNCSCLISGGGSLLQDASSAKSLLYYLFVIAAAEFFKKKVIIFAQGIGPIQSKLLEKITMFILKKTDYITVRDDNSLALLKKYGINAEKCSDPVWNIEIPHSAADTGIIGVQLRKSSMINDKFINKLAENVNEFYKDKTIHILSLQNSQDIEVCTEFYRELKALNPEIKAEIILNTDEGRVLQNISECGAVIAARYHACLAAIKAEVKVLCINYDIKVKNLAEEFNLRCINSAEDMEDAFKAFVKADAGCDKEYIKRKKFDFKRLESFITA